MQIFYAHGLENSYNIIKKEADNNEHNLCTICFYYNNIIIR